MMLFVLMQSKKILLIVAQEPANLDRRNSTQLSLQWESNCNLLNNQMTIYDSPPNHLLQIQRKDACLQILLMTSPEIEGNSPVTVMNSAMKPTTIQPGRLGYGP